jgi:hypothetical protein
VNTMEYGRIPAYLLRKIFNIYVYSKIYMRGNFRTNSRQSHRATDHKQTACSPTQTPPRSSRPALGSALHAMPLAVVSVCAQMSDRKTNAARQGALWDAVDIVRDHATSPALRCKHRIRGPDPLHRSCIVFTGSHRPLA